MWCCFMCSHKPVFHKPRWGRIVITVCVIADNILCPQEFLTRNSKLSHSRHRFQSRSPVGCSSSYQSDSEASFLPPYKGSTSEVDVHLCFNQATDWLSDRLEAMAPLPGQGVDKWDTIWFNPTSIPPNPLIKYDHSL